MNTGSETAAITLKIIIYQIKILYVNRLLQLTILQMNYIINVY